MIIDLHFFVVSPTQILTFTYKTSFKRIFKNIVIVFKYYIVISEYDIISEYGAT